MLDLIVSGLGMIGRMFRMVVRLRIVVGCCAIFVVRVCSLVLLLRLGLWVGIRR